MAKKKDEQEDLSPKEMSLEKRRRLQEEKRLFIIQSLEDELDRLRDLKIESLTDAETMQGIIEIIGRYAAAYGLNLKGFRNLIIVATLQACDGVKRWAQKALKYGSINTIYQALKKAWTV